ncbi:MAG: ABC transporter ATP-binding protein/permease [Lachnospiraceae bacterium]|nr:ABC transporter ATP-binding protein/permease [Lachnospiraceae bacterium]
MKKYISYFGKYWYLYLFALVCLFIYEILDMISPTVTRSIIDDVITNGEVSLLPRLLIMLAIVGVGRVLAGYAREFTFDKTSFKVASDIRKNLFGHIQSLSVGYFDRTNTGEIMSRVKDDVDKLQGAFGFIGMMFLQVVIHTVMILWCMWHISPVLTIFPMIALPVCAALAIIMEKKLDNVYEQISDEDADMNTVAEENLTGVRVVKAFARENFEIGKFLSHNRKYYDLNMKQSKVWIKYNPYMQMITKMLTITALLLGGMMVIKGDMTLGSLGAFLEYCANAVWPMEMLGWLSNELAAAFASKKKLDRIYAEEPVIRDPYNSRPAASDTDDEKAPAFSSLEFDNVSFTRDKTAILSGVSFRLENGKTLGIMGATGSGKTTIINMMLRFYDPDEGRVLLNGTDLRELPLKTVRKNAEVVMQDVFLFSDTIAENIRLGKKNELTEKDISEALEKSCAGGFVSKLEDGIETVIGERGVGLSGGQKQRISMARAFAKHAGVLVLDDSTSALDMETEHEVQKHLGEMEGLSKIIIAHRISAVRHADEIIVLENGHVSERGTHDELLAAKGYYYKTYMAQYGEFLAEAEAAG